MAQSRRRWQCAAGNSFLLLSAEGIDHRPDHADAKGERSGCRMCVKLFVEDVVLHGSPAGAAILLRPMADAPTLLVEDAPPGNHLVLGEMPALHHLAPRLSRQVITEKLPHLLAKCLFLFGESEIHPILRERNRPVCLLSCVCR